MWFGALAGPLAVKQIDAVNRNVPPVQEEALVGIDLERTHAQRHGDHIAGQHARRIENFGDDLVLVGIAHAVPQMRFAQLRVLFDGLRYTGSDVDRRRRRRRNSPSRRVQHAAAYQGLHRLRGIVGDTRYNGKIRARGADV